MLVVGIGGTTRPFSSSEVALRCVLSEAERRGAEVVCFGADDLQLPLYDPTDSERAPSAVRLIGAIREASGIVLSSPGYHGTVSGLVKNALDYVEDTADDARPYFADRPVGCIGVAYGWQAAVNTLRALRDTAHALRGWPTPYGAAINATGRVFENGSIVDHDVRSSLHLIAEQVLSRAPSQVA